MPSPSFLQCIQCCCPFPGPSSRSLDASFRQTPDETISLGHRHSEGTPFPDAQAGTLAHFARQNEWLVVGGRVSQTRGADNSLSFRLLCSGYDQFHLNLQTLFSLPQLLSGVLCFLTTFARMLPHRSSTQIPA